MSVFSDSLFPLPRNMMRKKTKKMKDLVARKRRRMTALEVSLLMKLKLMMKSKMKMNGKMVHKKLVLLVRRWMKLDQQPEKLKEGDVLQLFGSMFFLHILNFSLVVFLLIC